MIVWIVLTTGDGFDPPYVLGAYTLKEDASRVIEKSVWHCWLSNEEGHVVDELRLPNDPIHI